VVAYRAKARAGVHPFCLVERGLVSEIESRCQTRQKSDGILGESGDSERVEGTVLDFTNIDRATKVAKHVLVSRYTLHCTDVAVVDFDGTPEDLQEAIKGGTDESDALCERIYKFWVDYYRHQKCGAEWYVDKYEDWADCRVEDPKELDKKVSELPVHKLPSLEEVKEELAKAN